MARKISHASQELADRLHSVAIHLLRKLRREDASSGLNAPRLSALSVLVFGGPTTLGKLAAAEQVRAPTMTRIVQALEEQGLVQREPRATDGRTMQLSATPAGRTLLIAGRERRVRVLAQQLDALSPEARQTLSEAAAILNDVIRDA